jgi:peptide/nickel transport system permease protein
MVRLASARWELPTFRGTRYWALCVGGSLVFLVVASSLLAPVIAPYPPTQIFAGQELQPPSHRFPWGTDSIGRDVLSRTVYAGKASLSVVVPAVLTASVSGIGAGVIIGYRGGITDLIGGRILDVLLAFPSFVLALAVAAVFGPTRIGLTVALALPSFPQFAILTRSAVMATKERDFITVAKALGASHWRIVFHHLLPNTMAPLIIQSTVSLSVALLVEASLSYLGLGVQPPWPSWGGMLSSAQDYITVAPWLLAAPGVAITTAIVGFNLLGDGLRDLFDPQVRRSTP